MTIIDSIKQSQTLLQQISTQDNFNPQVIDSLSSLKTELDTALSQAQQLVEQLGKLQTAKSSETHSDTAASQPEMESGCYVFAEEKGFFCPRCYDRHGHKVATARINKKLRVCPECRASIK